jgi:hypothetical protein
MPLLKFLLVCAGGALAAAIAANIVGGASTAGRLFVIQTTAGHAGALDVAIGTDHDPSPARRPVDALPYHMEPRIRSIETPAKTS